MRIIDGCLMSFDEQPVNGVIDLSKVDQIFKIGTGAFNGIDSVVTVILPDSIGMDDIEDCAFINCDNLQTVQINGQSIIDDKNDKDGSRKNKLFKRCKKLSNKSIELFEQTSIYDLQKYTFLIPSYQRGYKWSKPEICQLLNDLKEGFINNRPYILQPITVSENSKAKSKIHYNFDQQPDDGSTVEEENIREVIDGQQRITTICLIMSILNNSDAQKKQFFDLYYESKRFVDNMFVEKAKDVIEEWGENNVSEKHNKNKIKRQPFIEYIGRKVYVYMYEITESSSQEPEVLFDTLNKNLRLTNAELFKAFLLSTDGMDSEDKHVISKIASEWDQLERKMNNPEFWAFVNNENWDEKTKIDLLLEIYAHSIFKDKKSVLRSEADPMFSFEVLKDHMSQGMKQNKKRVDVVKDVWENGIRKVYNFLEKIYKDYYLYHLVGFLINCESDKIKFQATSSSVLKELYKFYQRDDKTIDVFKDHVEQSVKRIFNPTKNAEEEDDKIFNISEVTFFDRSYLIRDIFLYFNIWLTMSNKTIKSRFPFYAHKNPKIFIDDKEQDVEWQIEHINPRSFDVEKDPIFNLPNDSAEFAKRLSELYKAYLGRDRRNNESLNDLIALINEGKEDDNAAFNSITNLCLLDSHTNEKYKNAPFNVKREFIIYYDTCSTYIPIGTKKVFLKAMNLSNGETNEAIDEAARARVLDSNLWTRVDQEQYEALLNECFRFRF